MFVHSNNINSKVTLARIYQRAGKFNLRTEGTETTAWRLKHTRGRKKLKESYLVALNKLFIFFSLVIMKVRNTCNSLQRSCFACVGNAQNLPALKLSRCTNFPFSVMNWDFLEDCREIVCKIFYFTHENLLSKAWKKVKHKWYHSRPTRLVVGLLLQPELFTCIDRWHCQ